MRTFKRKGAIRSDNAMEMTKQTKFFLAVAVQLLVIFAIVIYKVSILAGGTEVLLQIAPVDPRDVLRGDYVTFQYTISNLEEYLLYDKSIRNGDTAYVVLTPGRKYWVVQRVEKKKPISGEIFLAGKVVSGADESSLDPFSESGRFVPPRMRGRLHIVYGIEEYFIPEGKGSGLNLWDRGSEAFAVVAVDENGSAVLKKLYVDDKPWP